MIRRQLPVYSPVTLAGVTRAGLALAGASEVLQLQTELATRYSAARVDLVGSGTQGLQLAIGVARRRVGGAVAMPAFQCYDLASAAIGADVQVALYDMDPGTLAPDLESLRRALKAGARTVVVAPLYGMPVPWDALAREVGSAGGVVIEDAAQGHGATWQGRALGSLGPLSVLSFGRGKGWCGGSGGALLLRQGWEKESIPAPAAPALGDDVRVVVQLKAQWLLGRPSMYGIPAAIPGLHLGETVYHPPRGVRGITKAAVAAVRAHAGVSDREAVTRRENAAQLARELGVALPSGAGALRLPLRLRKDRESADVPVALGVARSYPTTLARLDALRGRMLNAGEFPGAERLARTLVTAPTHSRVTADDRRALVAWLQQNIEGRE